MSEMYITIAYEEGQKFVVRYSVKQPNGKMAVGAWEATSEFEAMAVADFLKTYGHLPTIPSEIRAMYQAALNLPVPEPGDDAWRIPNIVLTQSGDIHAAESVGLFNVTIDQMLGALWVFGYKVRDIGFGPYGRTTIEVDMGTLRQSNLHEFEWVDGGGRVPDAALYHFFHDVNPLKTDEGEDLPFENIDLADTTAHE